MAEIAITPARAVRRRARLDRRAILGLMIVLAAATGLYLQSANRAATHAVLVAARPMPAGATIGPGDLTTARVALPPDLLAQAIDGGEHEAFVGRRTVGPLYPNQPLVRAQFDDGPALPEGLVALSVATSPAAAAGGQLRPGDRVLVLVTTNKGRPEAETRRVLERATVHAIGRESRIVGFSASGAGGTTADRSPEDEGSIVWVTLALHPDDAALVAQAKWQGEIDLALVGGR